MIRSAVALFLLAPLAAAQDGKAVERWVEDLQSDDVEVREAATQALKKKGRDAVALLQRALEKATNPEVKGRLSEILGSLKVPAEGGKPVLGLKIHLACDRKEVRPGEELRFTVALWNVTNAPMNLYVGYSTGGVYFESGSAFRVFGGHATSASAPRWQVGFCGTGAGPLYAAIPPYGSLTFETVAVLEQGLKGTRYVFGKNKYLSFEAPEGALHTFRVAHAVEPAGAIPGERARTVGKTPLDPRVPSWSGSVVSNDVEVEVKGAGK